MLQTKAAEKIKTRVLCSITFFCFETRAVYEVMWKNIVEPDRPCMTIWRMCIARCVTKATNTNSKYVALITFPPQQWLHERASMLRCTYIVCLEDSLVLRLALSDNSSIMIRTNTEHWWNYTDRTTIKYFEEIKSCNVQCTIGTVAVGTCCS